MPGASPCDRDHSQIADRRAAEARLGGMSVPRQILSTGAVVSVFAEGRSGRLQALEFDRQPRQHNVGSGPSHGRHMLHSTYGDLWCAKNYVALAADRVRRLRLRLAARLLASSGRNIVRLG
jgi:hypothetical protein